MTRLAEPGEPLADLDIDILQLAADGHTDAEIGAQLHYSPSSISGRLKHVYRALPARSRAHAVAMLLRSGQIT